MPKASSGNLESSLGDADFLPHPFAKELQDALSHSPYLLHLSRLYPHIILALSQNHEEPMLESLLATLTLQPEWNETQIMQFLRNVKSQASLLIGLSDLLKSWTVERVTQALSDLADLSVRNAIDYLLYRAAEKGEISLPNKLHPSRDSGFIVLGMGKLGAGELNYSSDIDLILLFDKEKLRYTGRHNPQHFFNRLAQDFVRLMQERTADGYVFRTDLRLRPDPASTPPVNSIAAAMTYYETVGQNWERAALIKARPIAGDIEAGENFVADIRSFIWRKHLDFAAIADIQSIRRQMKGQEIPKGLLFGYNIKLGAGGIREIEFFTQIHQLIWGGRIPELRGRSTCKMLVALVTHGKIPQDIADTMIDSYRYYRQIEHRVQMINDEQRHTLPETEIACDDFSRFCGYENATSFSDGLRERLRTIHRLYRDSFRGDSTLSAEGNLVFTGADHDEETLLTIQRLGFKNAAAVSDAIRGWHHGKRRATRTKRARELITELTPSLLKALADTADPDEAFLRFDHFIAALPAGIQLFSLFKMNASLLSLVAEILGNAPALAEMLSRHPILLDSVLVPEFHTILPDKEGLSSQLSSMLEYADGYEDAMLMLVQFRQEKTFQSGVQFLKGMITVTKLQHFLSHIAECTLEQAIDRATQEFSASYGVIKHGSFGILGLGRLGSGEVAYLSDLDIIFLYDAADDAVSDGEKTISASVYYNRLAQRITGVVAALTPNGRLYDIDTRLRPSGKDGPLAVSLVAFNQYFSGPAWNYERMALCKARLIYGNANIRQKLETILVEQLHVDDVSTLEQDIAAMRSRIQKEFADARGWDVKHASGGLMEIDFLAEYLLLSHPSMDLKATATTDILVRAVARNLLTESGGTTLINAIQFQNHLLNLLRLCAGSEKIPEKMITREFMARHMGFSSAKELKEELLAVQRNAAMLIDTYLNIK